MNTPYFRHKLTEITASTLSETLKTEVIIGDLQIGLFNRVTLKDVLIKDQQDNILLKGKRISAKLKLLSLMQNQICIRMVELIDVSARLEKQSPNKPANYQFIIDALSSKKEKEPSKLNLQIRSLIIRRSDIRYDIHYRKAKKDKLDINHLNISNLNANISLKSLTNDSVNLRVRSFSFYEKSGLRLNHLGLRLLANRKSALLSDFLLKMPGTYIHTNNIGATFHSSDIKQTFQVEGELTNTFITLKDFSPLIPILKNFEKKLYCKMRFRSDANCIDLKQVNILDADNDLNIQTNAFIQNYQNKKPDIKADIKDITLTQNAINYLEKALLSTNNRIPKELKRLGEIHLQGKVHYGPKGIFTENNIETGIGNLKTSVKMESDHHFSAEISSPTINLDKLLNNSQLGSTGFNIQVKGIYKSTRERQATLTASIDHFTFNQYKYKDISLNGGLKNETFTTKLKIEDPNAQLQLEGSAVLGEKLPTIKLLANIYKLRPKTIHLSEKYNDALFSANLATELNGNSPDNLTGTILINDFQMQSHDSIYYLKKFSVRAEKYGTQRSIQINSDFMDAKITGKFLYANLPKSFYHIIKHHVPALNNGEKNYTDSNDFSFDLSIHKPDFFLSVLQLPLDFKGNIDFSGYLNAEKKELLLEGYIPQVTWDGSSYSDGRIYCKSTDEELKSLTQVTKQMKKTDLKIVVDAKVRQNHLQSEVEWTNNENVLYKGHLKAFTSFIKRGLPTPDILTTILPTELVINDSVWNVYPSSILASNGNIQINNFRVSHNTQYLKLNGMFSKQSNDSITAEINDLNLEYLFNLLNFHPVDFTGQATGKIYLSMSNKVPSLLAKLNVKDFTFNGGYMGLLNITGGWNNADNQIDLDAHISEPGISSTFVKGFVSPARDGLDLSFNCQQTHIEFLNSFLSEILSDIKGRTSGWCRLYGPFNNLNLQGDLLANADATVNLTQVRYSLLNDSVKFRSGHILFKDIEVSDEFGNKGLINGEVNHDHLRDMHFRFNVHSNKMLLYDQKENPDLPFYGKVFGSGDVQLWGEPGQFNADMNITPSSRTVFVYNADRPDEIDQSKLLTYMRKKQPVIESDTAQHTKRHKEKHKSNEGSSDVRLNVMINTNPDATIKIIMDNKSGDNITVNGDGMLRASFYNKGKFQLFGTYTVDHGIYKMSIQDIIRKDFLFSKGGTVSFSGDPNNGDLSLQATYTVNSASLNDLNIGTNFGNGSVKVNCILNFNGKVGNPKVSFDLDLPTVNTDEKQLVRNLINTEEDMNMQIIYLLSIGRFYPNNAGSSDRTSGQNQSSIAMNSLISNTLSGQLNSMLSNVINNNNWTFGTNLSTGDEGWKDMEVEGLLSGRLLNNRLLINGNFGYRDKPTYSSNFVGDFNIQYLLTQNGNISLKAYSEANDRYFTRSTLTTQGGGIILKREFDSLGDLFGIKKNKAKAKSKKTKKKK